MNHAESAAASPDGVVLRAFTADDGPATLEVFERAIRVTARSYYSEAEVEAWLSGRTDPDRWAAARLAAGTVVADLGGRVVGFTDLSEDGYIDRLFVDPDQGRRGIGAALLRHVRELAAMRGMSSLSTHASLVARPVFERAGFAVASEEIVVRGGESLRRFLMTATITN